MRALIVIGQVGVDIEKKRLINRRSVDELLIEYANHFDKVLYIGPGSKNMSVITSAYSPKINFSTYKYKNSTFSKLMFPYHFLKINNMLKEVIQDDNYIVQLRLPSIFSMLFYSYFKRRNFKITTYVAGDWVKGINLNYSFPGKAIISSILDKIQTRIIKNTPTVTAGPILAEKYSFGQPVHVYYSTSHNEIYERDIYNFKKNLIFIGRIEPLKRLIDLLFAMKTLGPEGYKLRVIGEGKQFHEMKAFCEENNLVDYVEFLGFVNEKSEITKYLLDSDILVLPSLTEGTPKVIPEAMSCGCVPIAIKDVGSLNHIIKNGVNGFLISPKAPDELIEKIRIIENDEELRKNMINNAYVYANEMTLSNQVTKLWNFVKENLS